MANSPTPANPLYARQSSLNLSQPQVTLIGCGGVGVWVALALVLGGIEMLTLYDGDTISDHNLNRFPLPLSEVGKPKSLALADWLYSLRPNDVRIEARGELIAKINRQWTNPPTGDGRYFPSWIICATDSLKSRLMAFDLAKDTYSKYLEIGADGERWTLSPNPPEFSTDLEEQPGYQTVPVHVGPCMMAGAAAAYYVLHNSEPKVSHSGEFDILRGLKFRTISEVAEPDPEPDPEYLEDDGRWPEVTEVAEVVAEDERIDNEQEARTQVEE